MNKDEIIQKIKPHLNETEMNAVWDMISQKDYQISQAENTLFIRDETMIKSARIKNLTWVVGVGLGLLTLATIFLGVESAKINQASKEFSSHPIPAISSVTYGRDERAEKLDASGVRWSVNQYPDKICIVLEAANEPQWQSGTNYSTVTLKVLPKIQTQPAKQLE